VRSSLGVQTDRKLEVAVVVVAAAAVEAVEAEMVAGVAVGGAVRMAGKVRHRAAGDHLHRHFETRAG
jgi:hypothetical protein